LNTKSPCWKQQGFFFAEEGSGDGMDPTIIIVQSGEQCTRECSGSAPGVLLVLLDSTLIFEPA